MTAYALAFYGDVFDDETPDYSRTFNDQSEVIRSELEVFDAILFETAAKHSMLQSLGAAEAMASDEDWDDQGGLPLQQGAVSYAKRLISKMPLDLPAAEVTPSSDGSVLLEWIGDNASRVIVKIKRNGKMSFATASSESIIHGDAPIKEFNRKVSGSIYEAFNPYGPSAWGR